MMYAIVAVVAVLVFLGLKAFNISPLDVIKSGFASLKAKFGK